MRKLKILILSWRGPKHPLSGGAEIATFEHAKRWINAGNKVTLFTSYFNRAKTREVVEGLEIVRRGGDAFGVKLAAFFWYLFVNRTQFDLVVDEFHGIPFFTPFYVRVKKLAFIHEVAKEVWWLNPWPKPMNLIPGVLGSLLEPLIFKLLYHEVSFMTVSQSTKEDLVKWGIPSKKVTIIHNGVNTVPVNIKKENQKTVIFLGALAKDKGIEDALKVFAEINKNNDRFQFWVVGWGSPGYLADLKRECKNLRIEDRVKFWGFVSERKKFELLSRAHILINPSVREGWGLVNIEANTVGTPVVGYDVPGTRDSVQDGKTGLLSRLGDFKDLAKNIDKLFKNKTLYKVVQKNAVRRAYQFTWAKSTSRSLKLIKKITNS